MAKAPAFPFSPTEIVIALETFHGYPNVTVRQGTRLRGDNPIVHTWPDRFIADGASDDELTRARQKLHPEPAPQQHVPLANPPKPLLDEDSVICIKPIFGSADGDSHLGNALALAAGTRMHRDSPLIASNRDAFVPVVPEGRTRENSVRALADITEYRKDEGGNYILETDGRLRQVNGDFKRFIVHYRGQWVSRDDPKVRQFPRSFEAII